VPANPGPPGKMAFKTEKVCQWFFFCEMLWKDDTIYSNSVHSLHLYHQTIINISSATIPFSQYQKYISQIPTRSS